MTEVSFVKSRRDAWQAFEKMLNDSARVSPDALAESFIQLTDDLAYARTFFPRSKTTLYLNTLTGKAYQSIYKNRKERSNRLIEFWRSELPLVVRAAHRPIFYSLVIFLIAAFIGAFSTAGDDSFVRLILGDSYVNMTLANIKKGDPMAVYKQSRELPMFLGITLNNIRVSFFAFAMGVVFSFGTACVLLYNGIMLGAFQYFFYKQQLLIESALVIWIHGTLEISAIVLAGGAGLAIGNAILFPGTFSRRDAFMRSAKHGMKIIIGLIPIFIVAGFLESFVTRHTDMPLVLSLFIIFGSLSFIVWYFVIYPILLEQQRLIQHSSYDRKN
ncbi:MAG: membrane protein [[Candidatus Thermochlorobacteriaceae] bacterium GBChlB]|nr:MAG: membrane protein [[Candidatus Thermochlorobacteriaceae] bacterium GBChlB]